MTRLRVSHIGICVSDWRRSLRFYQEVLGFRYLHELEATGEPASRLLQLDDVALRAVYLEREGMRIELLYYERPGAVAGPTPRPMNQLGFTHLSLRVDDLDAFLSELRSAGVEILEDTRVAPAPKVKAAFLCDPDGALIELVEQPGA